MTTIEAAAKRWAGAYVAWQGSSGQQLLEALLELDTATHELIRLTGTPCPMCADGTCPTLPISDTPPL